MSTKDSIIDAGTPEWIVTSVEVRPDYHLFLTFIDGSQKLFDVRPLLSQPFFAPLKDPQLFAQAHLVGDTVGWPQDIDIAPETLYAPSPHQLS